MLHSIGIVQIAFFIVILRPIFTTIPNTMANSVTLAGHVEIDDFVVLGGLTAIHQFCKIGAHVITMGGTLLSQDVPPYVRAVSKGGMAFPNGINSEGLKRRGFSAKAILAIPK